MHARDLRPDEWPALRALRLEGLRESPDAFASTYTSEAAYTDDVWRDRIATSAAVFVEGQAAGIAGCIVNGRLAELVGMWVAPAARGKGGGRALVKWALDRAHGSGCRAVELWVAAHNDVAIGLYTVSGFERTGDAALLAPDRPLPILRMSRPISGR